VTSKPAKALKAAKPESSSPDIFRYTNYRDYLRDYYAYEKAKGRGFSYRVFSRRAGLGSPNHMQRVINGTRGLSDDLCNRFALACRLTGDAHKYFLLLVSFNQAKDVNTKRRCHESMLGIRRYRQAHELAREQAAYFSQWYLTTIRELVLRPDFKEKPAWIAKTLRPEISQAEAAKAIELLLSLGLLSRDESGRLCQTEPLVSTGDEVTSFFIGEYHRCMMTRAADAIDVVPRGERDISSLTLGLSKGTLVKLKKRVQEFRKELMELASSETSVHQVVQFNLQLFPLSDCHEG